ncbi:hypothetical protein [Luteimonas padinae]|uniref:Uncharacterized protein n=1 Tax=Luteimonas padinae TaxID=1714359 RepID=A0ABV6SUR5_9GAMM|nr:hypothetical protein [Luteimonas padinae]
MLEDVRVGEVTAMTDELAAKGVLADIANRVDHTLAHWFSAPSGAAHVTSISRACAPRGAQ